MEAKMTRVLLAAGLLAMVMVGSAKAHEPRIAEAVATFQSALIDAAAKRDFQKYKSLVIDSNTGLVGADDLESFGEGFVRTLTQTLDLLDGFRWHDRYDYFSCGPSVAYATEILRYGNGMVLLTHVFLREEGDWRVVYLGLQAHTDLIQLKTLYRDSMLSSC